MNKLQNFDRTPYTCISLNWFSCQSSILAELECENVGLSEGRRTRELGEKPLEQGRNQQQTQLLLTHMTLRAGIEARLHIGGRQSLLPLSQPCSFVYCTPAHVLNLVAFWILFVYNREKLTTIYIMASRKNEN